VSIAVKGLYKVIVKHGLTLNMRHDKGKGKKVKLSLCVTKHHAMKAYWGVEV
jgi:hypothetical protein